MAAVDEFVTLKGVVYGEEYGLGICGGMRSEV